MTREEDVRRLRSELAGLRVSAKLVRLELKYREDQARVPKGQPGGGRFADEHGAGKSRALGFVAPLARAAARTAAAAEEAAALTAGGAAAAAGVLGGAMLGLTGDARQPADAVPQTSRQADVPPPGPPPKGRFDDDCKEQLDADLVDCQTRAAMYGRTPKMRSQINAICERTAIIRYSECLKDGPSGVSTPLYDAQQHTSPRKR